MLFVALAITLCAIVQWRYAIFRNDVDLGIFTQVIGGLGRGFSSTAEGRVNHLLVHWSPLVVTAWPFLRVFGPVGLEYFQALLVASVVFPIFALARARFNEIAALGVTVVATLYPILWANGVGDFHEMAFVPLLSATLVYALDRRRWWLAIVAATLLLCTKEDQFFILAFNGLVFAAISRGDVRARRTGLLIAGGAFAMALIYFGAVRPSLNPHLAYGALEFFHWSTQQPYDQGVLFDVLLSRLRYIFIMLLPLAFLPCRSRYGWFLVPGFVEILASNKTVTLAPGAHYTALLTGYALAAFVDGAYLLHAKSSRIAAGMIFAAAAASVCIQIFASPMEYWYYLYRRPEAHDALLTQTLARLPPGADVGAEDEIFAHLGLDRNASVNFNDQQWFVYDRTHYSQRWQSIDEPAVRNAIALRRYVAVSDRDGIVVLKRVGR